MRNESHDNTGSDRSPGTCKERDGEIHPTDTEQRQNTRATEDHTTWNIAYPYKGTTHQIDFYHILTHTLDLHFGPEHWFSWCHDKVAETVLVFI